MRTLAGIVLLASASAIAQDADVLRRFDYDRKAPLDVVEIGSERRGGAVVHDISYASPKGGRVPAYLVVPEKKGRHAAAAVIWGHWYWENSSLRNRGEFLDEAIALAPAGVVSLLTDGPIARPGHVASHDPLDDRDMTDLVQQIVDMRRGADLLLLRKDVDAKRLAYVGHSYNASVGAFLSGIDKRFKAFVLMAGGLSNEQDYEHPEYQRYRQRVGAAKFDAFVAKYAWLDPGKFVSHAAPAAVFLQFAAQERFLTPEGARRYAALVSEPKRFELYDAPHALNAAARRDRLAFLAEQLHVPPLDASSVAKIPDLEQPPLPTAAAADAARVLLERAIAAAGGASALEQATALSWDGNAKVHLPDRQLEIVGTWKLEPPDRAIVETRIAGQDPKTGRTMIVSGARGWMQRDGQTTPLPDALVEHERGQFYLYYLLRLVPLRSREFVLEPLAADADGRGGFRVKHPGRPTVDIHFDEANRPRTLIDEVTDPTSGAKKRQVMRLEGDIEVAGIHWPRSLRISWDEKPYFDLEMANLKLLSRLQDERLAGPAR